MEYTGQGHGASQPLSVMMHELLAQAYGRSTSARAFLQGRSCPGSRAYNMLSCTIAPDESRPDSEALSSTPTSCAICSQPNYAADTIGHEPRCTREALACPRGRRETPGL